MCTLSIRYDFVLYQTHYVADRLALCRPESRSERMIAVAGTVVGCEEGEPLRWGWTGLNRSRWRYRHVPTRLRRYGLGDMGCVLGLSGGLWPEIVSMAKERFELEQARGR